MNQLNPVYQSPIKELDADTLKSRCRQHSADMQGGFLVSDWSRPGFHTYWVNPGVIEGRLAEVNRIKGIKYPPQFISLINFLSGVIADVRSRILFIAPQKGIAGTKFQNLAPGSIYDENKLTRDIQAVDFSKQHIPNDSDEKLIQIARWRILQEGLAKVT